jgi:hypothetical protein
MRMRLIPLGLVAGLGIACEPNVFHTTLKGVTTVQGNTAGGQLTAFPAIGSFTNLDFSQNQDFKAQRITKEQLRSVKVEAIRLRIQSPQEQDFDFLDELSFVARTPDDEVLVAERRGIRELALQAPNPELALDATGKELRPVVTAPQMSIVGRGKGRVPPQDTHLEAEVELRVEIELLQ